jgi:tight adherence protein B
MDGVFLADALATIALVSCAALALFWFGLFPSGGRAERRKEAILAGARSAEADEVGRFARLRSGSRGGSRLEENLKRAGLRFGPGVWLGGNVVLALVVWLILRRDDGGAMAPTMALAAGMGLPNFLLGIVARRRQAAFMAPFAEAMDVVVRGLRSGLPLGVCLVTVGREVPDPLGAEFRAMSESQRFGMSMKDAVVKAAERNPVPEMRFFAASVAIQQQTGGNLADTLSRLSEVLRSRKRMRDKVRAFSTEAKTSAMIIGFMPFGVAGIMLITSPRYLDSLFATQSGHVLLGVGAAMLSVGIFVISKMIDFDM